MNCEKICDQLVSPLYENKICIVNSFRKLIISINTIVMFQLSIFLFISNY